MKCPKCTFTHGVFKFCPFCGVPLVDAEDRSAREEGPGPPDTSEHQKSPGVASRQGDCRTAVTENSTTEDISSDKSSVNEANSTVDLHLGVEPPTRTNASPGGDEESANVTVGMTETNKDSQPYPKVLEGESSNNNPAHDPESTSVDEAASVDQSATKENIRTDSENSTSVDEAASVGQSATQGNIGTDGENSTSVDEEASVGQSATQGNIGTDGENSTSVDEASSVNQSATKGNIGTDGENSTSVDEATSVDQSATKGNIGTDSENTKSGESVQSLFMSADTADQASTEEQRNDGIIDSINEGAPYKAKNSGERSVQPPQVPSSQQTSSFATPNNQDDGVMQDVATQSSPQTNVNDTSTTNDDGKDRQPQGITPKTESPQMSSGEPSSSVSDTPPLAQGNETATQHGEDAPGQLPPAVPLQAPPEDLKQNNEPDEDQKKSECRPTEGQGEDVEIKETLKSGISTPTQGSASEGGQADAVVEKEEHDTIQARSSNHNDNRKDTSEAEKGAHVEHMERRPNQQSNENPEGNESQPTMSRSKRKRMKKKERRNKNLADPVKKDESSYRPKTEEEEEKSPQEETEEENTEQTIDNDNMTADKMMLYFHVLLRPDDFDYNPEEHHVEVRSNLTTGTYGFTTLTKMAVKRETSDYLVLEGQKEVFPHQVAHKAVEYKYAVVRKKASGKIEVQWEFIHRHTSFGIMNRCMWIPKDRAKAGGVWHNYNGFMLNKESKGKGRIRKTVDKLTDWLMGATGVEDRTLVQLRMEAAEVWLPKWNGLYCGDDAYEGNASDALSQIDNVSRGIVSPLIILNNTNRPETWEVSGLNMKKVIEEYTRAKWDTFRPTSEEKQSPAARLASALAITYLIWKFDLKVSKEKEEILLEALSVEVDTEKMTCVGLREAFTQFEPGHLRELPKAVYSLIESSLLRGYPTPKWLLALPIYHFLKNDSQPFEPLAEEARVGDPKWFGLEGVDIDKLRINVAQCRPPIKDFLSNIKDLLCCDHLLSRSVSAVFKLEDLAAIFGKRLLSPSVSVASLGFTIRTLNTQQSRDRTLLYYEQEAIRRAMEEITAQCKEESSANEKFKSTEHKEHVIHELCSACEYFLGVIMENSKELRFTAMVAAAVCMVASCMRLALAVLSSEDLNAQKTEDSQATRKEIMNRITKCYASMSSAVFAWLKMRLPKAIAMKTLFHRDYESTLSIKEEPEMWSQLADVTFGEEHQDTEWRNSLADKLRERIKQVSPVYQAELFCQVDLDKLNSVIAECFTNAAFTAVESLCQINQEHQLLNRIAGFSPAASKYGKLFSNALRKTWHLVDESCETSLLRHLLSWQPFLGFFKMYTGASVLKETLDLDCQEKIVVAVSKLEDVERKLLDGTITVEELEILIEFSGRFFALCQTITPLNQDGEESQSAQQPKPTRGKIGIAMYRRKAELEAFKVERRHLQKFLGMSEIISPVDRSTLQQKVDAVIDRLPVCQLCAVFIFDDKQATANGEGLEEVPTVTFFNLKPQVKAILDPVGRLENSTLFQIIWKEQAEELRNRIQKQRDAAPEEMPHSPDTTEDHQIELSIDQVVTNICMPALKVWEEQRESIETGEITLEDVDKYFGGIMGRERDLLQEIAKLSDHPSACWVKERAEQIRQYHLLGQYIEKASRVNDVRRTYQLGGDFSSVETLLDSRNASFKMRPLRSMDDSVFKATSILAELTEATSDALNAFVLSKPLVEWMRKHTKDTKELKVFADLASISAGETDIEIDRVNMLLSAGIGYGPLIYDLKQDAGFPEMMQATKRLETYLTQDPNLPKKLRDMKNHLAWLTHVQESHGSVEKSSLSQAEAINARGIYEIGHITQPKDLQEPLDGVVTLRLSQAEDDDDDDRHYSVSNLKTLQSKLMLIAGTADKGKEEVEKFVEVFNGVIRLGNVYLRLRRTGSVLFDKWTCILFCDPQKKVKARIDFGFGSSTLAGTEKDLVTEVTNLAKFMESCLEGWLEFVDFKRGVHPELNNFTTEQIVVLRRELANVLNGDVASSQALVLLDSVKTHCSVNDLKDAFSMIDLDDEMVDDISGGSAEEKGEDDAPVTGALNREALLRELHNFVPELSDDMAEAALKVCQRGNFNETLDEAIDWCINNYNNDELVQEILGQKEDTTDARGQHPTEASPERSEEHDNSSRNVPRLAPLPGMSSLSDLTRWFVTETKDRDETLVEKVSYIWHLYLKSTQFENMKEYLSLDHLGRVVEALSTKDYSSPSRPWPDTYLKEGVPNLIVCPAGDMFRTVLSLYLHGGVNAPLPSYREVLLCTSDTTTEEIVLLWKRAVTDQTGRIFCLVNIDQLDHDVSVKAEEERSKLMQRHSGCHLVLTCARETQHQSYIATALEQYRVQQFTSRPLEDIQAYLSTQLVQSNSIHGTEPASSLDYQRSSVRVISSDRPGLGKSLYVQRLAEKLQTKTGSTRSTSCYLKVPFHEAVIDVNTVLSALNEQEQNPEKPTPTIIHLDMSPLVRKGLDYFLFNLTVLGRVMGKDGKVWLRLPWDLYLIERTSGATDDQTAEASNNRHVPFVTFLPSATCRAPTEILALEQEAREERGAQDPVMDATHFSTEEFQRPYHYLRHWEAGEDLDKLTFTPGSVVDNHADFLNVVLRHCGIKDPSWAELRHFLSFLNHQLRDCEQNVFCQYEFRDSLPGLKKFVVEFMIIMSKDFATPSLEMADESPSFKVLVDVTEANDNAETAKDPIQYHLRRRWENCPHPYLFFNSDRHTMTFLGFNVDANGDIRDPTDNSVLQHRFMTKPLRQSLVVQRVELQDNFEKKQRSAKIDKLRKVMGLDKGEYFDPDESYELTTDNVKKILAIHMRFRCNIPVIIMGETGCGKTRLVKFMCDLQAGPPSKTNRPKNMVIMKIHGGVTAEDIIRTVTKAQRLATENQRRHNVETVLFLDEANTSEAIGLIKEIMCDGTVNGKPLPTGEDSLKIVAAVNPYRRHTKAMIRRLEQAGLGYHIRAEQTEDKLGRIPMRQLVYRVQPLPPSMLPLVWDFGQLNSQTERLYIEQMVKRCVSEDRIPAESIDVVTSVLTTSQEFMRRKKDECSFVSLRDVERTLTVMAWFLQIMPVLSALMNKKIADQPQTNTQVTDVCRALILALGVCYQARLEKRNDYRKAIAKLFKGQLFKLPKGAKTIEKETEICQDVFLDQLDTLLAPNIARNTALKENVFMMVVCIELRIPLFLVGKPGSSKSLAKSVVSDAMQGDSAPSDFFKRLKQAHMVSFQCSPLATPESIVKTFHQCSMFQQDKDLTKFVSVVVLDEIGLAEDSPKMPLKTLHPLLEEGYVEESSNGGNNDAKQKKVAFVGISNWALDPAKMNRGIFLSRGVPDNDDLKKSARGICEHDEIVMTQLQTMLGSLAGAYTDLYRPQLKDREYFGLRDFYSLIKMVSNFCRTSGQPPSRAQLEHAIRRNFSGRDDIDPLQKFRKVLETCTDQKGRPTDPDCSPLGLIGASLQSVHSDSEGRYLLILTKNYAALSILQQKMLDPRSTVILFGSSFPQDQEYTQVCRDINRIKVCMETGRTVVLLNLENLYESLYDALNQYYVEMGGQKYVDLGLGTHRVKCRVHKDFRLVVVAEKDIVYDKFPIPLINRLEKHFLSVSTILTPAQNGIAKRVDEWAKAFVNVDVARNTSMNRTREKPADAFIGYHEDLPATVVLQVFQDVDTNDDNWEEKVFERAKETLLQCATPNAVVRLGSSPLSSYASTIAQKYFRDQHHSSLADFLLHTVPTEGRSGISAQVTTHGRLLSRHDLPHLAETLGLREAVVQLLSLQQFDTEQQFSRRIRHFLEQTLAEEGLLVVQCDSGDINYNLIACASYTVQTERAQTGNLKSSVVFVIQLPRNTRTGFSGLGGGQWLCYHIDDVHPPNDYSPDVAAMLGKSVSSLVKPRVATQPDRDDDGLTDIRESIDSIHIEDDKDPHQNLKSESLASPQDQQRISTPQAVNANDLNDGIEPEESKIEDDLDVSTLLRSSVQSATARVTDPFVMKQRTIDRIDLLLKLLANKGKQHEVAARLTFAEVLRGRVALLLEEQEESRVHMGSNWLSQEAAASKAIRQAGTFRRAAWVYLLSVVSPMLAEVIAFFDRNSNLDLLIKTKEEWLHQLWLGIAANDKAVNLHYEDCLSPKKRTVREAVPVQTSGYDGQLFQCQLPFSWLIKELVDKLWQDAKAMPAGTSEPFQEILRNTFDETEIGRQLSKTAKLCSDPAEVIVRYIYDYVYMTHKITSGSDVEVRLICRAVEHAVFMVRQRQEIPQAPHITDVHVAVDDGVRGCLSRFSQLVEFWPDQLPTLETALRNRSNMKLDVAALRLALEKLTEELWQLTTAKDKQPWMSKLQSVGLLAEDLLAAYKVSSSEQQQDGQLQHSLHGCRCLLARLRVVKLYIDHLCGADQPLPMQQVEKLWKYLDDQPDFKTKTTMKKLELFLVTQSKQAASKHFAAGKTECCICLDELSQPVILPCKHVCDQGCLKNWLRPDRRTCPTCRQPVPGDFQLTVSMQSREALQKHQDFRRRSNAFFMDVVSMFCFADDTPPKQEVIDMLLGYIVREVDKNRARTKGFSPFEDDCVDRTPIIRSFLLQLLLRFKFADVCAHLESYFEGARDFAGSIEDAIEVCIIFVQCMENALSSQVDRTPGRLAHLVEQATRELQKAARLCKGFPSIPLMLQLNMIASIRFGLSVACDLMYIEVNQPTGRVFNDHSQRALRRLFENVQALFSVSEAVTRWPKVFIPKYLYRRHGLDTLLSIGQARGSQWFLPAELRGNQEEVVPDRFVVYGEAYQRIREATAKAILTNDSNQLVHALQKPDVPQRDKEVLTLLAIFTEVTLAVVSTEQNANVICQMQQMLVQFSRSTAVIRNKELAEQLIKKNNGGHCTRLSLEPNQPPRQRSVSALIIHFGVVLATTPSNPLLEPLKALVVAPHNMMAHYLPTMPEDPLPEVKKAFASQDVAWYQCPNGHHYVIGDCTRPYYTGKCHCGADIGGTGHKLLTGNRPGRQDDATSTGHIIGEAQDRHDPAPERQLSQFATVMTRLVLHAAMLNGANGNPQPFTNFVRPVPVDINDFLWRHLNRDLDDLASVLGRSIDDATLLVHILLSNVPHINAVGVWNVAWTSTQGRQNWEEAFNNAYIKPLLQNLDSRLQEANRLVDGDHRLIDTSFHRVLHDDTTRPDQLSLENVIGLPEMWQYRPSVSLEHMSRRFVEHQARFPVLKMFLDNAIILSAMCHLPDIIHLTTLLKTRYHRNIDLTEVLTMKIADFLKSIPEGQQRDECEMLVKRFSNIWTNIRPLLLQQDSISRPENMGPVIDVQTTSLYHLLPMKEDATITSCITAVVLFLIRKNNEFLDIYRKTAHVQDDGTLRCWTDVSASNVVSCDPARDLMPLVLSHCNYSLAIGKGTQVGYDFAALEKRLIDRFLCGKCKIVEKCETFQFRQEARDVAMFTAVRKQIPQESISIPIQRQIVLESTSLENVCISLAAVDIAIFFLASAGGDGDRLLGEYLHRVLKMGKASRLHSDKVRNYCRLIHALSLWQLLSVQRARLLLSNGQDPFDNVDSSYTKQLEEEQITTLRNALKNIDVNTLCAEIYEFLVVSDEKEKRKPEWSLRDTLAGYLDEKDAPEINGFLTYFPETILLEHACDTWRIIANYNQEEDSTVGN